MYRDQAIRGHGTWNLFFFEEFYSKLKVGRTKLAVCKQASDGKKFFIRY